ncbi:MAG: phosphate acetyltransferase [Halobacteriovoraceae bacterium]|nr:phosphate acetyltransferase [Halobacteriovoraceae bacterium]
MANSLYVSSNEPRSGKSLVSLALTDLLLKRVQKVGFFKPIIERKEGQQKDSHIKLVLEYFKLSIPYEKTFGLYWDQVNEFISQGLKGKVFELILEKYKNLEEECDFILCEGTNFKSSNTSFEAELNIEIAQNLSTPVLIVGNAKDKYERSITSLIKNSFQGFKSQGVNVLGSIINRVPEENKDFLKKTIRKKFRDSFVINALIPEDPLLISPTMREVTQYLKAEILYGEEKLSHQAYRYSIAAMHLSNYLERLTEHCLVITPGDRDDIIMGVLMAHRSKNFPAIAGIILSSGTKPSKTILSLLDGLPYSLPILSTKYNTFETASLLNDLHSQFIAEEPDKIYFALKKFEEYVDTELLSKQIIQIKSDALSPKMFEYICTKKAKKRRSHIVLPEGADSRVLKATHHLLERNIVEITLLGDVEQIKSEASKLGLNLSKANIVDPALSDNFEKYTTVLYNLRKHKGLTMDGAKDLISDVSYFGTMMVHLDDADGMVSGAIHTTQHTIRPALQFIKTRPEVEAVSSVFFMCLSDRVLVYGDCAINPNPDSKLLAEIAIASAETAESFGIEPKVAMLSYSSGSSGKGEDVEKVKKATEIVKEKKPDLKIEGPIQYDAAVDPEVGQKKIPGSKVAGQASVLIFPDLNTGNNTYKAVQRETGAVAIGPLLQGLNKPVNDLSRGCTVPDIVNTVIMTAIQAQESQQ